MGSLSVCMARSCSSWRSWTATGRKKGTVGYSRRCVLTRDHICFINLKYKKAKIQEHFILFQIDKHNLLEDTNMFKMFYFCFSSTSLPSWHSLSQQKQFLIYGHHCMMIDGKAELDILSSKVEVPIVFGLLLPLLLFLLLLLHLSQLLVLHKSLFISSSFFSQSSESRILDLMLL